MMTTKQKIIPVILCGGSGSRLWPLSRQNSPKQFLSIDGDKTLLGRTLERVVKCSGANPADIITVTTNDLRHKTQQQLTEFDPSATKHIIGEPSARNTTAAIGYAALYAQKEFGNDAILWVVGADYHIEDDEALTMALSQATQATQDDYLLTFGIKPSYAETGYGYIKAGDALEENSVTKKIASFKEKPNKATAERYFVDGDYLWNSGMFLFSVHAVIENYIEHASHVLSPLKAAMKNAGGKNVSLEDYNKIPSEPFDVSIMEKTHKAAVIPCDIGWSDVGSWESVWQLSDKDKNGNAIKGRVSCIDSENCLIQSNNLLVATVGLKDIIAIEYADSILIADKKNHQSIKTLVTALKKMEAPEAIISPIEKRNWGRYKTLSSSPSYIIRELTINSGDFLSAQMHQHRSESITIVSGTAHITIDGEEFVLSANETISIPEKTIHAIMNKQSTDLVLIETQSGEYLGEDDIVYFSDDYTVETA